jgi:hypothetical protein
MEQDPNTYDVEHVCTAHSNMSNAEWETIYREAWSLFYTPAHLKTLMRRAAATGGPMASLLKVLVSFATTVRLENVHPLQSGILKRRSERRPGMTRDCAWVFWSRIAWQTLYKHAILSALILRLLFWKTIIAWNPAARDYMDQALAPVADNDDVRLDLLTKTAGAAHAIAHNQKSGRADRGKVGQNRVSKLARCYSHSAWRRRWAKCVG